MIRLISGVSIQYLTSELEAAILKVKKNQCKETLNNLSSASLAVSLKVEMMKGRSAESLIRDLSGLDIICKN